jgi:Periplasmic binding protein
VRSTGRTVVIAVLVAAFGVVTVASGGASVSRQAGTAPRATEVGVTPTTIHIAVIADVNTPLAPGLFKGSKDAVEGYARYINSKGGLAGRKVVVDFYDSALSADESRNALIKACQNDFATVGTTALFMNNIDDAVNCKDSAGRITGLPDVPELTTEPVQQNSPVSFPILVPSKDFSDPTGRTFYQQSGKYFWFAQHVTKSLHGVFLVPADLQSTVNTSLPVWYAAQKAAVKSDGQFNVHGSDTQDRYLPIATAIKEHNSTYVRSGSNDVSMANMRLEAQQQGVTSVKVWDCSLSCYSKRFLALAGSASEGQYLDTTFVPFEEAKSSPPVQAYLSSVGTSNADGFGAQAWTSALFFQDVIQRMTAANGVNGITRASFLATARTVHDFTAQGMIGKDDVGGHKQSPCFALLQVKHGKFTRVYPTKPATFDCNPRNVVKVTATLPG